MVALTRDGARQVLADTLEIREKELPHLEKLWKYRRGKQPHPMEKMLEKVPQEVQDFLRFSRVNMIKLVLDVLAQSLYVEGYMDDRPDVEGQDPVWNAWQANGQDSGQVGLHRAAFTFGASYSIVLPGQPYPVIRNVTPRRLTAVYTPDDDMWPLHAVEVIENGEQGGKKLYTFRVFDEANVFTFTNENDEFEFVTEEQHRAGVVPVVRFVNVEDTDDEAGVESEIEQLIPIQDQIDVTTFQLEVTKHYQAFLRQYIIGWMPEDETEKRLAAASRFLTFEDPDVKVGQLSQAQLDGYLRSEDAKIRALAVISQTPPHHFLGELVNMSSDALAAAEAGHRRKVGERERTLGAAHKQRFALISRYMGLPVQEDAEVRWADTEARSFAAVVDGLGKLAQMLHVPVEALWEMVPKMTQRKLNEWKKLAEEQTDSIEELSALLDRQADGLAGSPVDDLKDKAEALGILIRA